MVVGLGGVGSALVQPLAALLAHQQSRAGRPSPRQTPLILVDGDDYEEKNLRNQLCFPLELGQNKAAVQAGLVDGVVKAQAWKHYLAGHLEIESWLTSQRYEQALRADKGHEIALIVLAVDNDHCRQYVYQAAENSPFTNVFIVDAANGAGEDADEINVDTYFRARHPLDGSQIPWLSPLVKYRQLQDPAGRPAHVGCAVQAESQPQLRTSNMLAATLAYDLCERLVTNRGIHEGYAYSDKHGLRHVGTSNWIIPENVA